MAGDTPNPDEKVQTTVYITREQKQWLAENDELNLSGFVRRKLDEMRSGGDGTGEASALADELRRRDEALSGVAEAWESEKDEMIERLRETAPEEFDFGDDAGDGS